MVHPVRRACVASALLFAVACSGTDDPARESGSAEAFTTIVDDSGRSRVSVDLDIDLGGVTTSDVFTPAGAATTATPVVVMLHGTSGDRTRLHDLAREVAGGGVLVYAPDWPSIDQVEGYPSEDDEPYRRQAAVVVCALRYIRRTAAERGGNPDDLTVFGHSGGAMAGARVSMVVDPPWPGIDCHPETSHAPKRFIGSAGDYNGWYQLSQVKPEFYAPYDPTEIEPSNTDVEVRLFHGLADDTLSADESSDFVGHLLAHGLDARMISTDSGHADMIQPTTPAGAFVAEQIVALVNGSPSAFDAEGLSASMRYEGRCRYDGPPTFEVGRPIDVRFTTSDDPELFLLAFSVHADSTITDEEILAVDSERYPLDDPPEFVDSGGVIGIDQPGSEMIRLIFLESDQRWVLACVPVEPAGSEAPLIPRLASVLSPAG